MSRRYKFPRPGDYKAGVPAVFCPAQRVLNLYNQDAVDTAQRIGKKVRTWFRSKAHAAGWAGTHFLPEVQSNNGAGCILWRPPTQMNLQVVISRQTLVLLDDESTDES